MRNTCVSRKITLFYLNLIVIFFSANLGAQQVLQSTESGVIDDLYYTFWQDSGSASITLMGDGRYKSQWGTDTNNWIGGLGWQPAQPYWWNIPVNLIPVPIKSLLSHCTG